MNTICRNAIFLCMAASGILETFAIDGSWRGDLNVGPAKIPLVFNFNEKDGATVCTMDSPSQNAFGLPASIEFVSVDSIALSSNTLGATYCGRIESDKINGTFSQRGYKFPLTLQRELPLTQRRPQTPQPPFPYQVTDTVFSSADGTLLAGTFTLPKSYEKGKTPMCVFVSGSGAQNRDEELFEHKPFAVIADYLARNGVASFRYDDRGTAESQGDFASSTTDTFTEDAKAALRFARGFNESAAGIIGHSEGGTIALLLAEEGFPDFIVSLAGMAVSGKETILAQNRLQLENSGFDRQVIDDTMTLLDAVFDEIIRQNESGESSPLDIDAMIQKLNVSIPAVLVLSVKNNMPLSSDYFGKILSIDARKGMENISCPVLALNGSLDTQVDCAKNLEAIRNGVKNATTKELPGLNHLFQHAKTGDMDEYAEIRETISPEVLMLILEFIQNLPDPS